ncbi:MAG: hypothetical protein ABSF91_15160 [Bacteroidota bacterium]
MIKHEEGYLLPGKDKAEGNLRRQPARARRPERNPRLKPWGKEMSNTEEPFQRFIIWRHSDGGHN